MTTTDGRCCFASSFVTIFALSRFTIEFTQSAPAALQRITDATDVSIILILSDINMPGMTGLEMLPKAKAARPDVPVIMITAYGDAETKRKALEGGAEALFTKPIDSGRFVAKSIRGSKRLHDKYVRYWSNSDKYERRP